MTSGGATQRRHWKYGHASATMGGLLAEEVLTQVTKVTATAPLVIAVRDASCAMGPRTPGSLTRWMRAATTAAT
eukprot:4626610-Prymnesium_polylepis.2